MAKDSKLDLVKHHKLDYATPKTPKLITIGKGLYLAIDGMGPPGSESFQEKIGALYSAAYTIKFASKGTGKDFVVCKLEIVYWTPGREGSDLADCPKEDWHWRLLIRMPDFIGPRDLASATEKILSKGDAPALEDLHLHTMEGGPCIQMLHVGPYEDEATSIEQMRALATEEGLAPQGPHHEIYLSDPRRVEPAKLKTILRMPVQRR